MKSELKCGNCGSLFLKDNGEINRRRRLGQEVFYCSGSCHMRVANHTPERKLLNSELAKRNFAHLVSDGDFIAKALYGSQKWKYAQVEATLKSAGVVHQFEYPLTGSDGQVRIFDLAFPLIWVLVEFDGPNHRLDRRYFETVDAHKSWIAEENGWCLIRIPVHPNTVIPREIAWQLLQLLF